MQRRDGSKAEAANAAALFLLDRGGRVSGWSIAAERQSGQPPGKLRNMSFDRLFAADLARDGVSGWLRAAKRQGRFSSAGWLLRQDGSRFRALAVIEPLRAPVGVVAFAA